MAADRQAPRFFLLLEGARRGALKVAPVGQVPECGVGLPARRDGSPWQFVQRAGSRRTDLVFGGFVSIHLISPRFVAALEGFSGWTTVPAQIRLKDGTSDSSYSVLRVIGSSGPLDDSLSMPVIMPPPVPTGAAVPGLRGMFFDPNTWDGSDVFTPANSAFVMFSEAVFAALHRAKLSNADLEPADEIERVRLPPSHGA